ncbi:MAG: GntR family transcriptional regulator [Clostridiaceae bacterium]|nr:GntR family transcriptional regulator [Clostridiaceae bacterium]
MNKLIKTKIGNYKPLREIVFEYLREAILEGKLEPGRRLMEIQLAEELGVSRTPVREAIRKLELEGLVIMVARKGAYVADVSVKDIIEVLEIRGAIEGLAASLAAERMTDEEVKELQTLAAEFKDSHVANNIERMIEKDIAFHEKIFVAARNEKLYQISQGLREQVYRFRVRYISEYNKSQELVEEHEKIVKAISQRNPKKSYGYGMEHIENLAVHMMDHVSVPEEKNKKFK